MQYSQEPSSIFAKLSKFRANESVHPIFGKIQEPSSKFELLSKFRANESIQPYIGSVIDIVKFGFKSFKMLSLLIKFSSNSSSLF